MFSLLVEVSRPKHVILHQTFLLLWTNSQMQMRCLLYSCSPPCPSSEVYILDASVHVCFPSEIDVFKIFLENMQEGYLVYECNRMCRCNKTCPNRVLQNGIRLKLEIFKTMNKVMLSIFRIIAIALYLLLNMLVCRDGQSGQLNQFYVAHLCVSILGRF